MPLHWDPLIPSPFCHIWVSSQLTLLAMFNISVTLDTINHEILVKRPQFFCLASLATFSWLGSCLSEHSLCVVQGHPDPHGCYLYDIPKGLMLGSLPHITYTSAIGSLLTASVCWWHSGLASKDTAAAEPGFGRPTGWMSMNWNGSTRQILNLSGLTLSSL